MGVMISTMPWYVMPICAVVGLVIIGGLAFLVISATSTKYAQGLTALFLMIGLFVGFGVSAFITDSMNTSALSRVEEHYGVSDITMVGDADTYDGLARGGGFRVLDVSFRNASGSFVKGNITEDHGRVILYTGSGAVRFEYHRPVPVLLDGATGDGSKGGSSGQSKSSQAQSPKSSPSSSNGEVDGGR